jgi:hypothetical protein
MHHHFVNFCGHYAASKIGLYSVSYRSIIHAVITILLASAMHVFLKPIRSTILRQDAAETVILHPSTFINTNHEHFAT